jgi:hypothetical protein
MGNDVNNATSTNIVLLLNWRDVVLSVRVLCNKIDLLREKGRFTTLC